MEKIKVKLDEIKRALNWIEANCNQDHVQIQIKDKSLYFDVFDKKEKGVIIRVYNSDASFSPDLTYTEKLLK